MSLVDDVLAEYGFEDYAEEVGHKAVRLAKHSGRKTVKSSDLKIASK